MAKEFAGQEYAVATNNRGLKQDTTLVRVVTRISVVASVCVVLLSVVMITFCCLYFLSPVDGQSMMMTLNATGENTDSAIACRVQAPQRGEIVIMKLYQKDTGEKNIEPTTPELKKYLDKRWPNQDENGRYMFVIKRLIAVGGDQITVRRVENANHNMENPDRNYDYTIYINGEELIEDYLDPMVAHRSSHNYIQLYNMLHNQSRAIVSDWLVCPPQDCITEIDGEPTLVIPEGYYFVMGDNRNGYTDGPSWDSCRLGPHLVEDFVGTCVEVVAERTNMAQYLWDKFVYYVCFGWAWQK